ncbi:peptidylprolyl isomerase [Methylomonas paludis]|uniref:Peptidyl-prolyl cis-trans isomerase n=1 Tax=Methylomonas paludis TaxID=1173101 RepID=A0A975MKZ8_9GAMM|nr:peptidylprolyl isomerase [Methylomonas paludis]QWF69524.1 peptidylprolyl isomerase [Methylomonas paludis]
MLLIRTTLLSLLSLSSLFPFTTAQATVVTMETSLGNINIQLYDATAPQTVANFLSYVESGAYNNSIFHRTVPGFVLQGGGFSLSGGSNIVNTTDLPTLIPTKSPVVNEYGAANVIGTIAMAKQSGNANSATDQWFFNLVDNTSTLGPSNNGGYTVFGQIIGNGLNVVNAIANDSYTSSSGYDVSSYLQNQNVSASVYGAFTSTPLQANQDGTYSYITLNDVFLVAPLPASVWMYIPAFLGLAGLMKRRKAV